ncbi:MAG: sigma-70 family RNA polymerase sigma factor [Ruminiclostridium sp.]|nr:sigma-70 family RNA polymerase sigma factor [Ruminiclostridium sp.]
MDDIEITELFLQRKESAIKELSRKYGSYCKTVASNILKNSSDTEECLNDAYLAVWNSIPPQKPKSLGAYTAKIVRNKALDSYNRNSAQKRGGGEEALPIDELGDLVGGSSMEHELNKKELINAINVFLNSLDKRTRLVFVGRYWSCHSLSELAARFQTTEHNITVKLSRTRQKLKKYLHERGFEI